MKKFLLTLLGVAMIASCSTNETENPINSVSEKSVIEKSNNIEDEALQLLINEFNSLEIGSEHEVNEVDPKDENIVYATIKIKILCRYWIAGSLPPRFEGYGIDTNGQHYHFSTGYAINLDPDDNSYVKIIYSAVKVSKPDCLY